jgi:hypothetical protein
MSSSARAEPHRGRQPFVEVDTVVRVSPKDEEPGCDLCGRPVDADGPELTIDVDVYTEAGKVELWFCRQEHAAEWFSRPLPVPTESHAGHFGGPITGQEILFAALVLWGLAMSLIGCVTLAGWIVSW